MQKNNLYILSFFFYFLVFSQEPVAIHLTQKDGLPDKEFYRIMEDNDGFIWLAANKGLFRYDGNEFKLFSHANQTGLSVFSLAKDEDNTIWYTNLANQIFCVSDGEVKAFKNIKAFFLGQIPNVTIHENLVVLSHYHRCLIFDRHTKEEVFRYESKEKDLSEFHSLPFIDNDKIHFVDGKGNLLMVNKDFTILRRKFLSFEQTSQVVSTRIHKVGTQYLVMASSLDNTTSFYLCPSLNPQRYLKSKEKIPFSNYSIYVQDDMIYLGTNKGVKIYRIQNKKLEFVTTFLENRFITDIIFDTQSNLWLTTLDDGIYVIPNLNLLTRFQLPNKDTVKKVYQGKSNELFVFGKQDKAYCLNSSNLNVDSIQIPEIESQKYFFYNSYDSLYYIAKNSLLKTFRIKDNTILFDKSYPGVLIKDHDFISQDTILLATNATSQVTFIEEEPLFRKNTLHIDFGRSFSCIYNPSEKVSLFGTVKGLMSLDQQLVKIEITFNNQSLYIKDLIYGPDGSVWALSFKKGIFRIIGNQVKHHLNTSNGLLTNTNDFIRIDQVTGFLYVLGEKGLQVYDPTTNSFSNINKKNGLPSYDFSGIEILDQTIFIGMANKILSLDVNRILRINNLHVQKPKPYFTKFLVDGKEFTLGANEIFIPYDSRKLEIAFNTNGFLSKESVSYQYRLVEQSQNRNAIPWEIESSLSNKVIYNKLPEGEYIFELVALDKGIASDTKTISFIVAGVFYQQWWFYLLLALVSSFLIGLYFHFKNKRVQEKQGLIFAKQQQELENVFLKLESLRSQMNPHFIFNALNSIQDYILHNEKKLARTYLVKFSRLIRIYLEHSQKDTITIGEELEALSFYLQLEKDRFENSFKYELKVSNLIDENTVLIPTFLIQPYVENAIKHGLLHKKADRKLKVEFVLSDDHKAVKCIIDDNGVGRAYSSEIKKRVQFTTKSFSTEANLKRIELLNKTRRYPIVFAIIDKLDEGHKANGTRVELLIPIV